MGFGVKGLAERATRALDAASHLCRAANKGGSPPPAGGEPAAAIMGKGCRLCFVSSLLVLARSMILNACVLIWIICFLAACPM